MATENLQVQYGGGADFSSEAWEVTPVWPGRPMINGSIHIIWSGLDALDGEVEIEISNDEINWNCYGGGVACALDTVGGADNQVFEFTHFTFRYVRVRYTKNSVTTGSIIIRTHGTQQRKE